MGTGGGLLFDRINRQEGLSSDAQEMAVFNRDRSKSERRGVLMEMR